MNERAVNAAVTAKPPSTVTKQTGDQKIGNADEHQHSQRETSLLSTSSFFPPPFKTLSISTSSPLSAVIQFTAFQSVPAAVVAPVAVAAVSLFA